MSTSSQQQRLPQMAGKPRPARLNRLALELRVHGLTYQQIGGVLSISTTTAHQRVRRAWARLGVRTRKVLVRAARLHQSMIRRRELSLPEIVEHFYHTRTPRQWKELRRQRERLGTEKTSGQESGIANAKHSRASSCAQPDSLPDWFRTREYASGRKLLAANVFRRHGRPSGPIRTHTPGRNANGSENRTCDGGRTKKFGTQ